MSVRIGVRFGLLDGSERRPRTCGGLWPAYFEEFSNSRSGRSTANYGDGDKAEFVANLVLQAVEEGQAQYFANDRLRKMAGVD
jgi:hypothetical protein